MVRFIFAVCVGASLLSCNDDDTVMRRGAPPQTAEAQAVQYLNVRVIKSREKLEACEKPGAGLAVFVSDESQMLICDGKNWQAVGKEKSEANVWLRDANGALIGQSSIDTYLNLNGYVAQHLQVLLEDRQVLHIRPTGVMANTCHYEADDCSGTCLLDPGKVYIAAGVANTFHKPGTETWEGQSLSTFNSSTAACEPQLVYHPAFVIAESYDLKTEAVYPFAAPLKFSFED